MSANRPRLTYAAPSRFFQIAVESETPGTEDTLRVAREVGHRAADLFAPSGRPPFLAVEVQPAHARAGLGYYVIYDTATRELVSGEVLEVARPQPNRTIARLRSFECFFVASSWIESATR